MSEESRANWRDRFIDRLERMVADGDRGALADLRRELGCSPACTAYRYLDSGLRRYQEDAALLVGPLFALWHQGKGHPEHADTDLGGSLAAIPDPSGNLEKRFVSLLNCHREDLPNHLRQIVNLLRSNDRPLDWRRLLRHVEAWDHENRWAQREWARSFWAGRGAKEETGETERASDEAETLVED